MSVADLAVLYLLAGLASAVMVWLRRRSLGSALLALLVWPLWAPFALMDERPRPSSEEAPSEQTARIATVLAEAEAAARGTPFSAMLSREAVERIEREAERAAARLGELEAVLAQPSFQREALAAQIAEQEAAGASEAALRTLRLHLASVERLGSMRRRQAAALGELEQMLVALRGQLVVARYAGSVGSMDEGVDGIVGDLWARIEGLGAALESHSDDERAPPESAVQPRTQTEAS